MSSNPSYCLALSARTDLLNDFNDLFESRNSFNKLGQFDSALVLLGALAKTSVVLWRSVAWGQKKWNNNAGLTRNFVCFLGSTLVGH